MLNRALYVKYCIQKSSNARILHSGDIVIVKIRLFGKYMLTSPKREIDVPDRIDRSLAR